MPRPQRNPFSISEPIARPAPIIPITTTCSSSPHPQQSHSLIKRRAARQRRLLASTFDVFGEEEILGHDLAQIEEEEDSLDEYIDGVFGAIGVRFAG